MVKSLSQPRYKLVQAFLYRVLNRGVICTVRTSWFSGEDSHEWILTNSWMCWVYWYRGKCGWIDIKTILFEKLDRALYAIPSSATAPRPMKLTDQVPTAVTHHDSTTVTPFDKIRSGGNPEDARLNGHHMKGGLEWKKKGDEISQMVMVVLAWSEGCLDPVESSIRL